MKGAKEKIGAAADGKAINEVVRELLNQKISRDCRALRSVPKKYQLVENFWDCPEILKSIN